jgi:hypothetical protein
MIPLGELAIELVLAVGGALLAANVWVLLRPRVQKPRDGRPIPRPPSMRRVYVNIAIGALLTAWALVTLIAR